MFNQLTVNLGERSYPILIGDSVFSDSQIISDYITTPKVIIISNDIVAPLYLEKLQNSLSELDCSSYILPDGEQFKTLASFESIMSFLLESHASRDTTLIALGGGVVGDITGFAAACFQRGIPFIQVPTTLLSQVDSSVGGKTAVNHPLGKNMIGAFYQPKAVFIDTQSLTTLPLKEFSAGMAEVIKYGIIYDSDFFTWLESNQQGILQQQNEILTYMIKRCCEIKAEVVSKDERESGIRALLNLGHTFGHAIEAEMGYGNWLHGEAVSAGIVLACKVAVLKGWITPQELERIRQLLMRFSLPIECPSQMNMACFVKHMKHDKKVADGKIRFIIPTAIGEAVVTDDISDAELETVFGVACSTVEK